jgi:hypothetical protein
MDETTVLDSQANTGQIRPGCRHSGRSEGLASTADREPDTLDAGIVLVDLL